MAEDKKLEWMYEGPKSLVNREDYLLGKRIDKNFELYSDVVVKDRDERDDIFAKKQLEEARKATEGLPVLVARQEDPLAAIRLNEAKRRQELLNNPAFKLKAERMLRKEFEKVKQKAEKKAEKKRRKKEKKKRRESSSLSSEDEEDEKAKKRERSRSKEAERKRRHSKRDSTEDDRPLRRKSRSPERRRRDSRVSPERRRRDSKGSPPRKRSRSRDRHPKRRSRSLSKSQSPPKHESKRRNHKDDRPTTSSSSKRQEEMAQRLREMQDNAKWKDQVRKDNVHFARKELEKEANEPEINQRNVAFINAIKQRTEGKSVAEKIQQNRHRLKIDRSDDHDY